MLLAIDTATATASLALYDLSTRALLADLTWQARRRHTQDLTQAAAQLLALADVGAEQIAALAVTTGPGSFTGVRVGISFVKGMALGLPQAPRVVGVPTLTVTAAPWLDVAGTTSPWTIVCAILQAGRGRYNWCFFGPDDLLFRPAAADHGSGSAADLGEALARHGAESIWLVGEVDTPLHTAVGAIARVRAVDAVSAQRRAASLARLATKFLALDLHDAVDELQPLYLRPPSPEAV